MQNSLVNHFKQLTFGKKPEELYEPIEYILLQEGKKIRPKLVMMATELFDGGAEAALFPAAGFEMLHNFTLIHDDIMDNAPIRRGKETVYRKWNCNIAILAGDALATMALAEILKTPVDKETVIKISALFGRTSLEICEGQQYDLNFESNDEVTIDDYLEMIRLKTAVMLAACLKAGALVAQASEENQNIIYKFGIDLGMAFQLMDDLLDIYADCTLFGKKIGGDIETGKKTYPYLRALQDASVEQRTNLLNLFSTTEIDPAEKFEMIKKIFDNLNIREKSEKLIGEYIERANAALEAITVAPEKKDPLKEMTTLLCNRIK